jgi:arylsulfatase
MKSIRVFILAIVCFALAHTGFAKPPNIVLILADDLGYSDLGCYGSEIRTPNLDALGTSGLRFTQFYNCARCSPTRASLLTGLYPHQAGVGNMTGDDGRTGYRGALQPRCVTIGQVLKTAGYRTAAVGKWHVGDSQPPDVRGFDDFYGFARGYAVDSWEPGMMIRLPAGRPQRSYKPHEYFATDAITDHALDLIHDARQGTSPWLIYVAYQAPHFPLQSRAEDAQGYAEIYAHGWDHVREERLKRQKELGLIAADASLTPRSPIPQMAVAQRIGSATQDGKNPAWESLPADRRADLAQRMAVYAGMITGMDRNIGRIVANLREHHEIDNTLILFLSDNGACAEWEPYGFDLKPSWHVTAGQGINAGTPGAGNTLHTGSELAAMGGPKSYFSYGSGWANACNTPWRYYKHYVHEGGISTPLIVHWPAGTKRSGQIDRRPGHVIDIMATLVEVAGAEYPKSFAGHDILPMEGQSLVPALRGELPQPRKLFWEHEGNRAVRDGPRKLVALAGRSWELYDIESDREEMHNVAESHPDIVARLGDEWMKWARRCWVVGK